MEPRLTWNGTVPQLSVSVRSAPTERAERLLHLLRHPDELTFAAMRPLGVEAMTQEEQSYVAIELARDGYGPALKARLAALETGLVVDNF